MGWSNGKEGFTDMKREGNGFRKRGLKTGFARGKEGFTNMKI